MHWEEPPWVAQGMTFPATLREPVIALLIGHRAAMTSALAMGITRGDALILTIDILAPVIIPILIIALRRLPVIFLRTTNTRILVADRSRGWMLFDKKTRRCKSRPGFVIGAPNRCIRKFPHVIVLFPRELLAQLQGGQQGSGMESRIRS